MGRALAKYPSDIASHISFQAVAWEYPEAAEAGVLYVDFWPISWPMLIVFHPTMCAQFTQDTSLPKHEILKYQFQSFSQCKDLVTSDGSYWKKWRAIYNPGFSAQNIQLLLPSFVKEALIFREYLDGVAESGQKIKLESQVMRATCDIIGQAVL